MSNAQEVPHTLTAVTLADGNRDYDWTHPADCPEGDSCDIQRRTHRAIPADLTSLVDGRPDGAYRLARFGFHGLTLVDENGIVLPDVVQALPPAAQAAREVAAAVIRSLAEGICEDTERLQELCEIIRRAEVLEHWEGAANQAIETVIEENLGTMRAYTAPIDRLLQDTE